jgi:hypothetical protein
VGRLKKVWDLLAILFKKQEEKFTFLHELHQACVEKATPRAKTKGLGGLDLARGPHFVHP